MNKLKNSYVRSMGPESVSRVDATIVLFLDLHLHVCTH